MSPLYRVIYPWMSNEASRASATPRVASTTPVLEQAEHLYAPLNLAYESDENLYDTLESSCESSEGLFDPLEPSYETPEAVN